MLCTENILILTTPAFDVNNIKKIPLSKRLCYFVVVVVFWQKIVFLSVLVYIIIVVMQKIPIL